MLKYINARQTYYILFAISFGFVWYLFKFGGFANALQALYSTVIDIFFSLAALVITVELLLPRLFYKKQHALFALCFFLVIIVTGSLTILLQLKVIGRSLGDYHQYVAPHKHFFYWFWSDLIFGSCFLILFIALSGFAIRLSFDRILAAKQMETLENEKTLAELEMLKNQINPHFLFNALNTIYYKIDKVNPSARMMVEQFSSMLRYQLYECNGAEIEIEKELKFITNYIELQKERQGQLTLVECDLKTAMGFFIAPFILMPLVENCFKHVSQNGNHKNLITINGKTEGDWFIFETANTIDANQQPTDTGIGLVNVKKRLDLIYPDKHFLSVETKDEVFRLTLRIKVR